MNGNEWSVERVERLTSLWNEGFSCTEIANYLGEGASRNSVIGKVHRLKLARRRFGVNPRQSDGLVKKPRAPRRKNPAGSVVRRPRPTVKRERPATPPSLPIVAIPKAMAWEALPGSFPVPLVDLPQHACKWPLGDGSPWLACGIHTHGTYCPDHQAISVKAA